MVGIFASDYEVPVSVPRVGQNSRPYSRMINRRSGAGVIIIITIIFIVSSFGLSYVDL